MSSETELSEVRKKNEESKDLKKSESANMLDDKLKEVSQKEEIKEDEIEAMMAEEEKELAKIEKEREERQKAAQEENEKAEKEKLEKENSKGKDIENGTGDQAPKIGYFSLFRYANKFDVFLMILGVICAIGHGVLMPLFAVFFGDVLDAFSKVPPPGETFGDVLKREVSKIAVNFLILAAAAAFSSFLQVSTLMWSGQRQSKRLRYAYFKSLLSQEIGWYDVHETGDLSTHISSDIVLIQDAISEKIGTFAQTVTMFFAGFAVGFSQNWELTLIILTVVPLLMICGAIMAKFLTQITQSTQSGYGQAGGVAEEVISSIRTVVAFGGETFEKNRYGKTLEASLKSGIKKSFALGLGIGVTMLVMFSTYSLAFYYGNILINRGAITGGKVISVFFGVVIGAMSLGQTSPAIAAFSTGIGAASKIFEVINRKSKIDSWSETGLKPAKSIGEVEFKDVKFTYPSRPNQPILNGVSFSLKPGQTVALVGPSGCGKSTSIALLERFYDPTSGSITFDGVDIRELSLQWLRSQIGLVGQEPVLFNKTIAENISFGKSGATQEDIERVCKMSNAHDFIKSLPNGYNTNVGERGTQLSGGQKQRIAIARALLRDPKVLLLDEATSALDNNSEKVVQDALDKAREGRSTIVIAHRLSTIQNADMILVFDQGRIIEGGTHKELMEKKEKSLYQDLVKLQEIAGKEEEESMKDTNELKVDPKVNNRKISERLPSHNANDEEKPLEKEEEEELAKGVVWRSFKLNLPEIIFIIFGCLAAIANGAVFPVFSILFGEVLAVLIEPAQDTRTEKVHFWCLIFLALAVGTGLANGIQNLMFGISGEKLTDRLRKLLFASIIRQDIGWFDSEKRGTGILSTKLSTDTTLVRGMTGERTGIVLQLVSTLVIGIAIATVACWKLALVILACVPVVAIGGAMQLKLLTGFNAKSKKAYEKSGQVASEALMNMRTVISLGVQGNVFNSFAESLIPPDQAARRSAIVAGFGFAFGEAMQFLIWALAFYYGASLASEGECGFNDMMKAISAVVFSAVMTGQLSSLLPDFGKAKAAAASIFAIVDRIPPIDSSNTEGTRLESVYGTIEFKNVHFTYPTRPDAKILRGLSFTLKPGQTLALVGTSGCGKSTTVSLLERFYSPSSGQILMDGIDITTLNLNWLRRQMGLVGQEPVLFGTDIKTNIAYGKDGNATTEEIETAAKMANAHKFILALANGYDTDVGEKGSQLSGGQKQRVAIARALIRNPKILLLDEATSALDSESEKIVQHALNKARQGRTTIVIAHRLSTIQNADQIAVLDQGVVVEQGTHFELLAQKGLYYRLVNKKLTN